MLSSPGWRPADLFVLARRELPDELRLVDAKARPDRLIWYAYAVRPAGPLLLEHARSLPQEPRTEAVRTDWEIRDATATIVGRLLGNRNLSVRGAAELLVTCGGPYLAATTVRMVLAGAKALDAQMISAFAWGLGVPVADLAALCDVQVAAPPPAPEFAADLADLLWECRRLTAGQIDDLARVGHELRHRFAAVIDEHARCSCPGVEAA